MFTLEVYSTIAVENLKQMILEKSQARLENYTLHLFLKKQKLREDSFLFEAITVSLQM